MPQVYKPVKQRASEELRSALITQLRKDLESTDKASARQRETAIEKLAELQISAERLEAARLTRAPLQTRVNELEKQVEELQSTAAENAAAVTAQTDKIAALESQVTVLTSERDTARQDADRKRREADTANYQLSDKVNAKNIAEKNVSDTRAALETFTDGTACFIRALAIPSENVIDVVVKADKPVPAELLIAAGIETDRVQALLKTVKSAKAMSTERLIDIIHLELCGPCRRADATGRMRRMPSRDELNISRSVLLSRGETNLEQRLTILTNAHNPNANVYMPPLELPPVLSVEDREIERQKAAGTYVPPVPAPEPKKPTVVSLTRYWAPILPFRDPFQEFQISMAEFYPDADRSRTAYERLRREGLAQEAKQKK